MDWKETKLDGVFLTGVIGDVSLRWHFSPANKLARLLWRWLDFSVDVDWVRFIERVDKEDK